MLLQHAPAGVAEDIPQNERGDDRIIQRPSDRDELWNEVDRRDQPHESSRVTATVLRRLYPPTRARSEALTLPLDGIELIRHRLDRSLCVDDSHPGVLTTVPGQWEAPMDDLLIIRIALDNVHPPELGESARSALERLLEEDVISTRHSTDRARATSVVRL